MGFLTPVLIHNDAIHGFAKDPEQFMEIMQKACMDSKKKDYGFRLMNKPKWWKFWKKPTLGSAYCNYVGGLGTAHADVDRLVMIKGGTWIDLSRHIYLDWERKDEAYVKYLESCIKESQQQLTSLKKKLKEVKSEQE